MKKVTVRQLLMEIEQLENCGCFSPFLGTLKVTPVNRPKRALKVIRSFSKFACHLYIAKWGCPPNLKKIVEAFWVYTCSVERAFTFSKNFYVRKKLSFFLTPFRKTKCNHGAFLITRWTVVLMGFGKPPKKVFFCGQSTKRGGGLSIKEKKSLIISI